MGRRKKGPRETSLKSDIPDGETLYDAILSRISAVHREGRANTARNLTRYLTVGENGPKPPGVSVRVSRRKCRQMGFRCAKTKKVLTAERSKPYISRWMVRYCRRRVDQLKGGLPTRPRNWMDATFVNKWPTGSRSWITRDTADGDELQGANKGGGGERFTLLHAFSD